MTNKLVIQKYGGSSVASIEKIELIAQRVVQIVQHQTDVVVVVSAMGNSTDNLLQLARQIDAKPPARELDMLLSTGERTTMALLSIAIQKYGCKAVSFTGSQSGIITNDSHSNARIIAVRPFRIQDELRRGKIVIVAGYQGTSYRNEITTLGRGGSDMTAIALAAALGAEACEIYSDVDGVYTADPRVTLDAQKLDEISADDMLALAQYGAKVLNEQAVAFAKQHKIALYAKSTFQADSAGTIIRPDGWPQSALTASEVKFAGVASAKHLICVVCGRQAFSEAIEPLLQRDAKSVKILNCAQNGTQTTLLLDMWNHVDREHFYQTIVEEIDDPSAVVRNDCANVTVVGTGIGLKYAHLRDSQRALDDANIAIFTTLSSPNTLTLIVGKKDVGRATEILHQHFRVA